MRVCRSDIEFMGLLNKSIGNSALLTSGCVNKGEIVISFVVNPDKTYMLKSGGKYSAALCNCRRVSEYLAIMSSFAASLEDLNRA